MEGATSSMHPRSPNLYISVSDYRYRLFKGGLAPGIPKRSPRRSSPSPDPSSLRNGAEDDLHITLMPSMARDASANGSQGSTYSQDNAQMDTSPDLLTAPHAPLKDPLDHASASARSPSLEESARTDTKTSVGSSASHNRKASVVSVDRESDVILRSPNLVHDGTFHEQG